MAGNHKVASSIPGSSQLSVEVQDASPRLLQTSWQSTCVADSAVDVNVCVNGGMIGDIVQCFDRLLVRKVLYKCSPLTIYPQDIQVVIIAECIGITTCEVVRRNKNSKMKGLMFRVRKYAELPVINLRSSFVIQSLQREGE